MDDGVALRSVAHPRLPWYKRLLSIFKRRDFNPNSIETIEIDSEKLGQHSGPLIKSWVKNDR